MGMVPHVCYEAALEKRVACLAHVFTRPGSSFRETLGELLNFEHDPGYAHEWRMPGGGKTLRHPVVREKVQEMLDKEERDFGGVLSTAKTALTLYSDPLVARNTAASDFSIDDLVNHALPVSLYSRRSALRQDPAEATHPLDLHHDREPTDGTHALPGGRAEAKQAPSASADRRVSVRESHGGIRRCPVIYGWIRSEGLSDHAGHPANRRCLPQ